MRFWKKLFRKNSLCGPVYVGPIDFAAISKHNDEVAETILKGCTSREEVCFRAACTGLSTWVVARWIKHNLEK